MAPGLISLVRISAFSCVLGLPLLSFLPSPGRGGEGKGAPPSKDLVRVLDGLEGLLREAADPGDVKARAARLGGDVEKIFSFLREKVGYLSYPGSLRGAAGTLRTLRGNSLDQAILLAEMLRASGYRARIIQGSLSPEEARSLARKCLGEISRPSRAGGAGRSFLKKAAAFLGVPPRDLRAWAAWRRKGAEARREALLEEGSREGEDLARILQGMKVPLPPGRKALLEKLALWARDHFWVRVRTHKGWRDLDPVLGGRGERKGKPLSPGLGPFAWKVGIRLSLRRNSGGRIEEVTLLEKTFPLSHVSGGGCYLAWVPQAGQLPPSGAVLSMKPSDRAGLWKRVKILRAELLVRGESYPALPFDLRGRVFKPDAYGAIQPAKNLGGALAGKMGGLFGGGAKEKKEKESKFLGLGLVLTVEGPGGAKEVYGRTLFSPSRGGGKNPRALPAGVYAFLVQGEPSTPMDRFVRVLRGLTRNASTLRRIARGERRGLRLLPPLEAPGLLLRFAAERARLAEKLREGREGVSFLWDRPQVYALKEALFRDPGRGRYILQRGIDILENRLVPVSARGEDAGRRALVLGATDTALEASLLPPLGVGTADLSAWSLLARERILGGKERAEKGPGGEILVGWGPGARWEVDPRTWVPAGRVPSGAGQAMLEYAIKIRDQMSTICQVSNLASIFIAGDPDLNERFGKADRIKGYICGVVDGNLPAVYVNNLTSDMTAGLWTRAANALAGVE